MKNLTEHLIQAVERGERVVLCTILASSGSSPRGAGARMAVFADGSTMGTVGGGEVEYLALKEALSVLDSGKTYLRAFDLAPQQVASIGMICGGKVTIHYQIISEKDLSVLEQMRSALQKDENSWLNLQIRDGVVEDFRVVTQQEADDPSLYTSRAVLKKEEPLRYAEPLQRAGRTYIFGGGHVGQALVPVLAKIGFRVTVFDTREQIATKEHFPMAEEVILGDYNDIYAKVKLTENDFVVIMTPGHQSDFALLEQVLRNKTRYVGCIGSRHKIAKTQAMLREAGISEERIASVHSPIGLQILAETPDEIAISIAAEMIQCRAESL
ncbi:MAG: xanthine dehydrogenase accessory protein XdhC [Ruminococcaceae bacterium]|nr:xanthine dehydrogenase accessory protein XdhC [Oscillospiraceae bacterium]